MPKQGAKKAQGQTIDHIFGISKNNLLSIVQNATSNKVDEVTKIIIEYEKQGICGGANSIIATFHYSASNNKSEQATLFVKQKTIKDKKESDHYLELQKLGIDWGFFQWWKRMEIQRQS